MIRSISWKIRIISLLIVAIPVAAISYFFIYENMAQRRSAEIDKNIMITKSAALLVEHEISSRVSMLEMLANTPFVKYGSAEELKVYLESCKKSPEEGCFIASAEGKILVDTFSEDPSVHNTMNQCKYFLNVLSGNVVVTNQHKSKFTGEYVTSLLVPVYDEAGQVSRVLGTHLKNSVFGKVLDPIELGKTGRVSLIDGKGHYIYDRTIDNATELIESSCYYDGIGKDINVIERGSTRTGEQTLFTKVKIASLGWYIVSFQRSDELSAPVVDMVTRNIITIVLVFVVLLLLHQYQRSLLEQKELVKMQNAEKLTLVGELAAAMADEIRPPLAVIRQYINQQGVSDRGQPDWHAIEAAHQSADFIDNLVQEIQVMAKPSQAEMKRINLQELLKDAADEMHKSVFMKQVNLSVDYGSQLLLIKGDVRQLKRALTNLLHNSLETVQREGNIEVKLECVDNFTARITIKDDGGGMQPEILGELGSPLQKPDRGGAGLRLLIAQNIIEEHGGHLDIKSSVGKGTLFEIYLPENY